MFIAFTLACDQDSRSIARRWRLVYGADHMHHDCRIMFEDLFAMSGLSLERLKSFADIVAAGGISAAAGDDSNRQSQFSRPLEGLELYFGVVTRTNSNRQLESAPLGQLEYALFVPSGLVSGKRRKDSVELIGRVPLALLLGSNSVRQALEDLAQQHGLKLDVRLRLSSYPQLAAAVQNLKVAAVMPTLAASSLPADRIRMIRLPFLDSLSRRIFLVWNRKATEIRPSLGPYAKVFGK